MMVVFTSFILLIGDALGVLLVKLLGFPNALKLSAAMFLFTGVQAVAIWFLHVYFDCHRDPRYDWNERKLGKG